MFGWFRKYVRKVGIFGVEVEFHPPTETTVPPVPTVPPKPADALPPAVVPLVADARGAGRPIAVSRPTGSQDRDKAAFLEQVSAKTNGDELRVAEYERVLDDLIAWSEAQGG